TLSNCSCDFFNNTSKYNSKFLTIPKNLISIINSLQNNNNSNNKVGSYYNDILYHNENSQNYIPTVATSAASASATSASTSATSASASATSASASATSATSATSASATSATSASATSASATSATSASATSAAISAAISAAAINNNSKGKGKGKGRGKGKGKGKGKVSSDEDKQNNLCVIRSYSSDSDPNSNSVSPMNVHRKRNNGVEQINTLITEEDFLVNDTKHNCKCCFNYECSIIFTHTPFSEIDNLFSKDVKNPQLLCITSIKIALRSIFENLKMTVIPGLQISEEKKIRYINSLRLCLKCLKNAEHLSELEPYIQLFYPLLIINILPSQLNIQFQLYYLDKI
ncbi:AP2 domain transcription factor, putative, partial [Hepatocystis sp. ex Piliocolobus tephrosceles]